MHLRRRLVVLAQDDGQVHPSGRVGRPRRDADAEEARRASGSGAIAAADEQLGDRGRIALGISEEDDVEPAATQHPGRRPGEPCAARAVEHLDHEAIASTGNGIGVVGQRGGRRPVLEREEGEEDSRPDQGETTDRLFQNRTIGSGSGHPERAR